MIKTPMSRRSAGTGAAVLTLASLLGCSGGGDPNPDASGVDQVRVLTGLGFQSWEAYLYVAVAKGWFADAGMQVEVLPGGGTTRNLELMAGGEVEFATLDINAAIMEYGAGAHTDFVLTSLLHANLLACVMVPASSGLERLRDLEGRSVAVVTGGTNTLLFPALGPLAGFDAGSVELVSLEPPFHPYVGSGQVDASMEFVPNQYLVEQGLQEEVVVFPYAEWIPELYGSGIGVSTRLAEQDTDLVRRFNRAALRGLQYAADQPDEAAEIFVATHEEQDTTAVAAALAGLAEYLRPDQGLALGEFNPDRLVQSASMLQELGLIDEFVEPGDVVAFDLFS